MKIQLPCFEPSQSATIREVCLSDDLLRLIPCDPQYVPALSSQEQAEQFLRSYLESSDEVRTRITEQVEFIDPGANLQRVSCPACGAILPIEQWQMAMDSAFRTHFPDLVVVMPCCGTQQSLNDLCYDWPAGFARFVLEARNPGGGLDEAQIEELQQILRCRLRKIWVHL